MILGIGVDLCEIDRIERIIDKFGEKFERRVLNDSERRSGLKGRRLAAYLARQFAAKEAISKSLGTGMRQGVHFNNIIVRRNEAGAPVVVLEGKALSRLEAMGGKQILVSLSDERQYAIAYAVASR